MEKPAHILSRLIIITIVLLGLLGVPQEVSSENGTVVALPAYYAAFTCDATPISVRVENVTDLTAYHLEIDFTPGDLIVTNVENGGFIPNGTFEPTNGYDNSAGTIQFGMARDGYPTQPVDGSGVLINIWVQALQGHEDISVNFTIRPYVPGSEPTNGTGSALVGWPDAMPIPYTITNGVVLTQSCPSTEIQLSNSQIDENLPVGTTIGTFTTIDPDPNPTFTYSLIDTETYPDNALFYIDGDILKTNFIFNYEVKHNYLIRVNSYSGGKSISTNFPITITDVNDAPSGADKTVTILEDGSYTFLSTDFGFTDLNDSPANGFLEVVITTVPGAGTLSLDGVGVTEGQSILVSDINLNKLVFTPASNGFGSPYATFTFQVRDDGGTTGGGVNLDPTPNSMRIDVTGVNDPPVGVGDRYYVNNTMWVDTNGDGNKDAYALIVPAPGVMANDSDVDGDLLTVTLSQGLTVAGGTLTLQSNGSFIFIPDQGNLSYTDSFKYLLSDGISDPVEVVVNLTIDRVGPPVVLTWVEPPVADATTIVQGDDPLFLKFHTSALTDVVRVQFRWWNTTVTPNVWVIVYDQPTVPGTLDYSYTLDTTTLPNLPDVQVYAYVLDEAGSATRIRIILDHRARVFLPLIKK